MRLWPMQARSNGTKRPAMLDYEADCNKSVGVCTCDTHLQKFLYALARFFCIKIMKESCQ